MSRYTSLLQDEADSLEELKADHDQEDTRKLVLGGRFTVVLGLIIVIVLCSLLDVLGLFYLRSKLAENQPTGLVRLDELPFLSLYSHLDDIYKDGSKKATPRNPATQLPFTLTQVDASAPDKTQTPYPELYKAMSGLIPFNERRTIVTREVSTLAEFFATDYGMESCSLVLMIPQNSTQLPDNDQESLIDVWALNWDRSIDIKRVTWNSKPPRGRHLGIFSLSNSSMQQTLQYTCPSGTYQNVELSCRQGPCNLHILASGRQDFRGISMKQDQTI